MPKGDDLQAWTRHGWARILGVGPDSVLRLQGLSNRTLNVLVRNDLATVSAVIDALDSFELHGLRGMGKGGIVEIEAALDLSLLPMPEETDEP